MNLVDIGSVFVGRLAHVNARVFGERVENVQRDEAKVVHRPKTMTYNSDDTTLSVNKLNTAGN